MSRLLNESINYFERSIVDWPIEEALVDYRLLDSPSGSIGARAIVSIGPIEESLVDYRLLNSEVGRQNMNTGTCIDWVKNRAEAFCVYSCL